LPPDDDSSLLAQLRAGDPRSLDGLLRLHGDRLHALAYSLLGHRPELRRDAEDIVQETLLGALKSAPRFEGRSSLHTWLCRILYNQVALLHRSRKVRRTDALPEALESHDPDPDARLDVQRMLAALSEEHRTIIVLRELEGLSYDEIAEQLSIPRGTVESRLFRARQALKDKFAPKISEPRGDD
jgi:RNA polymerase sigma-70 factor (ECF subfamily)